MLLTQWLHDYKINKNIRCFSAPERWKEHICLVRLQAVPFAE